MEAGVLVNTGEPVETGRFTPPSSNFSHTGR